MNVSDIKDALLLGFLLAFMLGPVFFMLLQTSVLHGARKAVAFDLGAITADAIFIAVAFYGSKPALELIQGDPIVFIIGGVILFSYGVISFFKKTKMEVCEETQMVVGIKKPSYISLYFKGFFLNFINIGVLGFWLAMIVILGPSLEMQPQPLFQYFGVVLLGYFLTDLVKIHLAKQLRSKMTPEVNQKLKRFLAVLFILFGIALALRGFFPSDGNIPDQLHEIISKN